jgi:glucokinase
MSGTRVGVTDLGGDILTSRTFDVDLAAGPDTVLPRMEAEFAAALERAGGGAEQVFGVGVGVPGAVELAAVTGAAAAHPWTDQPIASRLRGLYGVPITVDVDVNLLAVAEHRSNWPDAHVLLALKVGTAIGCGLVIDGRVVQGSSGLAGEIGHIRVGMSDARCVCGRRGCLSAVASGAAIVQQLRGQGIAVDSARDVAALAQAGLPAAADAIRTAGQHIGEVLAAAINLLNPDVIVVWGYLADGGEHLFDGIRDSVQHSGIPEAIRHVRLERSALGDDAGITGAAATVIEHSLMPSRIDDYLLRAQPTRPTQTPNGRGVRSLTHA